MLKKEEHYVRNCNMLNRHPQLQPRMRSILLDWLIEVITVLCEFIYCSVRCLWSCISLSDQKVKKLHEHVNQHFVGTNAECSLVFS